MPRPNEPEITWTLSMDQANLMLSIAAKQPFEQVADLIVELRNQAQAQIQLFQQQHPQGVRGNSSEAVQ
jgi:hypothetical protein